jgi:hypothetical protein
MVVGIAGKRMWIRTFELPVPREIGSGFEVSAELGLIDRRRGGITRVVFGLGKSIAVPASPGVMVHRRI